MAKKSPKIIQKLGLLLILALAIHPCRSSGVTTDLTVYGDGLSSGWENWSWNTTLNFAATSPVHSGANSLSARYTSAWAGLYLAANPGLDSSPYDTLQFWVHGGSQGGQKLRVVLANDSYTLLTDQAVNLTAPAGAWSQVKIPLANLGKPAKIGGIVWQDLSGGAQPQFYLDDIALTNEGIIPPPPPPPGVGPNLSINVNAGRHSISEDIYGMNYATENLASSLRIPVRRWGGNSSTRYNWQTNMHSVGSDWYFENIPDGPPLADGSASDQFVEQDRRTKTRTILTVPLIGWTPAGNSPRNHPYSCGFKVSKYGAQQSTDPWDSDCGNGIYPNGTNITGNSPTDTSVQIGPEFISDWINHLTAKYGLAQNGGVAYYNLDNEPMLWNTTHRDVHPQPTTYDEMRDRTFQYAAALKTADPSAQTLGPVLWGWCAYFYSAFDGCGIGNDYKSHGNTPFVTWYLQQMKSYEQAHGVRILDYLDLHYYPQANGVALSPAGDGSTQDRRLRSTRSLWDQSYIDESWISQTSPGGVAVRLIPRMKEWIDANYPGTKLAITEYNWGALNHINGALAQAEVLGIFGREGLDLATLWAPPAETDPGAFAFRMYRNYDGAGKGFGDISTQTSSTDQNTVSIYAAQRSSDDGLTVIVINKTSGALTSQISLSGFTPQPTAAVYRYSSARTDTIQREADQTVTVEGFSADLPARSITLFVLMLDSPTPPPPVSVTVSPTSASLQTAKTLQFKAFVTGTTNTSVTWLVNGAPGGNATVGSISPSGLYTAPATVPNPATVTITAVSSADPAKIASSTVRIMPPAYTSVQIISPNGGESLQSGGTFTITWSAPTTATFFRLYYSLNNGSKWLALTPTRVAGNSYQWKVPRLTTNQNRCLVKAVGYDARGRQVGSDQSDQPFRIIAP